MGNLLGRLLTLAFMLAAGLLAGCTGMASSGSSPSPTPISTPTPAPTPTPSPIPSPTPTQTIDFTTLPAQFDTNVGTFVVAVSAGKGNQATVNGAVVPVDSQGNVAFPISLKAGNNAIELTITSPQSGTMSFTKNVNFNSSLMTSARRLLYVSSISPQLSGTLVLDLDNKILLGFIANKHARGISPDGSQIYMDDLSVISTATHQELPAPSSPLNFTQPIPSDGFVVSPDGTRLYSRDEILNAQSNQLVSNKLPLSVESGNSFAGPNQGGPAISADGTKIYCFCSKTLGSAIGIIHTTDNSFLDTGIAPGGAFLSDLTVSSDARFIFVTSYAFAIGTAEIFDANSFKNLSSTALGDFAGQIAVSADGSKVIFGSAGNPAFQGGGLTVVDTGSFKVTSTVSLDLADHVAISTKGDVFASSGDTPGIDVFSLQADGSLKLQERFVLGINQFVSSVGVPQNDEIEKVVLKQ